MGRLERFWQMLPATARTYIRDLVDRLEPQSERCGESASLCQGRLAEFGRLANNYAVLQSRSIDERGRFQSQADRHIERVRQLEADRDADIQRMGKLLSEVQFAMQTVKDLNAFYTDLATRRREDNSERVLGPCDEVDNAP